MTTLKTDGNGNIILKKAHIIIGTAIIGVLGFAASQAAMLLDKGIKFGELKEQFANHMDVSGSTIHENSEVKIARIEKYHALFNAEILSELKVINKRLDEFLRSKKLKGEI